MNALILLVIITLFFVEPTYAGPGGFIAKAITKTLWGKILLILLGIVFLPLILYVVLREKIGVYRAKKVLAKMSVLNKDFQWLNIEKSVKNTYTRVHVAWNHEDMAEVSALVSSWYWQNQQLIFLDEWKSRNLKNVCHLKSVGVIKPLFVEVSENENLEGTRIAFSITGELEDYLMDRQSRKVVEGSTGYQEVEKVWIMEYENGTWILDDIREGTMSLAFAKLGNIVPASIEAKLHAKVKTT
jgi:hypothetical protein